MVDPVSSNPVAADPRVGRPAGPLGPLSPGAPMRPAEQPAPGEGFAATLRRQLEQVSQMQTEAEQGIQDVLTGQTQNVTEVFAAARKAEVAFSLLMELRNKLAEAYTELKRLQV